MIERAERILEHATDEEALRSKHARVPWREAAAFRDFVAHAYDKVTPTRVWGVVRDELPGLLAQLRTIASENKWS